MLRRRPISGISLLPRRSPHYAEWTSFTRQAFLLLRDATARHGRKRAAPIFRCTLKRADIGFIMIAMR